MTTACIRTQFRTIDGLSIRFAESEDRDDHALLLSPAESLLRSSRSGRDWPNTPTWWRSICRGFGHSERRDALLSPRAMGEFVLRVADAFGLEHPHAVGPDIGTAAVLFWRGSPSGAVAQPCRWERGIGVPARVGYSAQGVVEAPDLEAYRGIDPRQSSPARYAASSGYGSPTPSARTTFPPTRVTVSSSRCVTCAPTPRKLAVLRDFCSPTSRLRREIIAGRQDRAVLPVNAVFLRDRLPRSKLEIIDAGHFTWEDGADEYAGLVANWWGGGYQCLCQ